MEARCGMNNAKSKTLDLLNEMLYSIQYMYDSNIRIASILDHLMDNEIKKFGTCKLICNVNAFQVGTSRTNVSLVCILCKRNLQKSQKKTSSFSKQRIYNKNHRGQNRKKAIKEQPLETHLDRMATLTYCIQVLPSGENGFS